jgi:hypothetical protein
VLPEHEGDSAWQTLCIIPAKERISDGDGLYKGHMIVLIRCA